jgi:hypothetical protein
MKRKNLSAKILAKRLKTVHNCENQAQQVELQAKPGSEQVLLSESLRP